MSEKMSEEQKFVRKIGGDGDRGNYPLISRDDFRNYYKLLQNFKWVSDF